MQMPTSYFFYQHECCHNLRQLTFLPMQQLDIEPSKQAQFELLVTCDELLWSCLEKLDIYPTYYNMSLSVAVGKMGRRHILSMANRLLSNFPFFQDSQIIYWHLFLFRSHPIWIYVTASTLLCGQHAGVDAQILGFNNDDLAHNVQPAHGC